MLEHQWPGELGETTGVEDWPNTLLRNFTLYPSAKHWNYFCTPCAATVRKIHTLLNTSNDATRKHWCKNISNPNLSQVRKYLNQLRQVHQKAMKVVRLKTMKGLESNEKSLFRRRALAD